jgi:RIO kinase 2
VECIRTFFKRRFRYESNLYPRFRSTIKRKEGEEGTKEGDGEDFRLDVVVAASGFKHSEQKVLEEVSCHSSTDTRVVFVNSHLRSIWRP